MPRLSGASLSLSRFQHLWFALKCRSSCICAAAASFAQACVFHLLLCFPVLNDLSLVRLSASLCSPVAGKSASGKACVLRHTQGMDVSTSATRGQAWFSTTSCHGLSGLTSSTHSGGRLAVIGPGRWLLDALRYARMQSCTIVSRLSCCQPCFERKGDITLRL